MSELWFKPACELAEAIQAKEPSPGGLMEASLERLAQGNPLLNAFIAMRRDEAMAEARATADRIARGEAVGPLAGLPFGVKELEDAEGFPSTHASVPFQDNWPLRACGTGCLGLKPSFGRIPMGPFQMLGWVDASVLGPITRTVRDAAMYMDAVVRAHEREPNSLPHPGYSYVEGLERRRQGQSFC